ncbi:uncharacterized protein [Leptinotarsa decemlineata]|uniref:uncharacterized protein n=1 Tax=Leptinotarsa decemlineata TaxID=7539 RepID=UPI003D307502
MGVNAAIFGGVFMVVLGAAVALQCYQCGMYNDGVGSITPCLNKTHMKLIDCPKPEHNYCIKYISEGSIVQDCVPKCKEVETWHSMTYCCNEDACNSGVVASSSWRLILLALSALIPAIVVAH